MAILIASTPSSAIFVKKIIAYRRKMLKETDSRVKLTNQLLSGIRVLKIYAWEAAQEAQVCPWHLCSYLRVHYPAFASSLTLQLLAHQSCSLLLIVIPHGCEAVDALQSAVLVCLLLQSGWQSGRSAKHTSEVELLLTGHQCSGCCILLQQVMYQLQLPHHTACLLAKSDNPNRSLTIECSHGLSCLLYRFKRLVSGSCGG